MLANDLFDRIRRASEEASSMTISTESSGGSRARYDDNIGSNALEDLDVMLSTNPEFRNWYLKLQDRVNNESDLSKKRELELKLMYPFKSYESTVKGKVKSDWEGSRNTYRDSDQNQSRGGEDGDGDDSTYAEGASNATDNYLSDTQRDELFNKYTSRNNSYKYTLESTGKYDTDYERDPADNVMTQQFMTKLIREVNKEPDEKVMTVLLGLLLRWGINLPTYLNRRDVPTLWWRMASDARKQGGIVKATTNLRKFLSQYGVGRYAADSFQSRRLKQIMMKITNSKDADEVFDVLTSPQQGQKDYGNHGKAKDYLDIDVSAMQMERVAQEHRRQEAEKNSINESLNDGKDRLVESMIMNSINEEFDRGLESRFMKMFLLTKQTP